MAQVVVAFANLVSSAVISSVTTAHQDDVSGESPSSSTDTSEMRDTQRDVRGEGEGRFDDRPHLRDEELHSSGRTKPSRAGHRGFECVQCEHESDLEEQKAMLRESSRAHEGKTVDTEVINKDLPADPPSSPPAKSKRPDRNRTELKNKLKELQQLLADKEAELDDYKAKLGEYKEKLDGQYRTLGDRETIIEDYASQHETLLARVSSQEAELEQLRAQSRLLSRLQQDKLSQVDRHEPTFDERIIEEFAKVNTRINALMRRRGRKGLTLADVAEAAPVRRWSSRAVRPEWYNPDIDSLDDEEAADARSLLLRLAMWNFLRRHLFDRARPFAVFGSTLAGNLEQLYGDMFPDFETSEAAAKWRAMTTTQLMAYESANPRYRERIHDDLVHGLATLIHDDMGYADKTLDEVAEALRTDMAPQLEPVLAAAIEFARLVARERPGYTLEIPDLRALGYRKADDDRYLTNCPGDLGIAATGGLEEKTGIVALVASPMLVKWGTGSGEQLTVRSVLCKAFVWRP